MFIVNTNLACDEFNLVTGHLKTMKSNDVAIMAGVIIFIRIITLNSERNSQPVSCTFDPR
jgi:hypothetical protein